MVKKPGNRFPPRGPPRRGFFFVWTESWRPEGPLLPEGLATVCPWLFAHGVWCCYQHGASEQRVRARACLMRVRARELCERR